MTHYHHHFLLPDIDQMVLLLCQVDHTRICTIKMNGTNAAIGRPQLQMEMRTEEPIDATTLCGLIATLENGDQLIRYYSCKPEPVTA